MELEFKLVSNKEQANGHSSEHRSTGTHEHRIDEYAKHGFYYTGEKGCVNCVKCLRKIDIWSEDFGSKPIIFLHKPGCRYVAEIQQNVEASHQKYIEKGAVSETDNSADMLSVQQTQTRPFGADTNLTKQMPTIGTSHLDTALPTPDEQQRSQAHINNHYYNSSIFHGATCAKNISQGQATVFASEKDSLTHLTQTPTNSNTTENDDQNSSRPSTSCRDDLDSGLDCDTDNYQSGSQSDTDLSETSDVPVGAFNFSDSQDSRYRNSSYKPSKLKRRNAGAQQVRHAETEHLTDATIGTYHLIKRIKLSDGRYENFLLASVAQESSLVNELSSMSFNSRYPEKLANTTRKHEALLDRLDLRRERDRLQSFKGWQSEVSTVLLAKSGFFYLGNSDRTQCFSCSGEIRNWSAKDDPMVRHMHEFPHCKLVQGREYQNNPITLSQERKRLESARNPLMNELHRFKSFERWPIRSTVNPDDLVNAGFFYLGTEDRVECFYCGVELRNWKLRDIPWIEHAMCSPKCEFLLYKKGGEFVDNIRASQQFPLDLRTEARKGEKSSMESKISKSELERLQEETLCMICRDNKADVVFFPCKHMCCCRKCTSIGNRCPMCGTTIQNAIL